MISRILNSIIPAVLKISILTILTISLAPLIVLTAFVSLMDYIYSTPMYYGELEEHFTNIELDTDEDW